MDGDGRIGTECRMDIRVEGLDIHDDRGPEYQSIEGHDTEGGG